MVVNNGVLVKVKKEDIYADGSFIIPAGIKEIGDRAFAEKHTLKYVVIPEGVEKIGFAAFESCTSLLEVVIPKSVKKIERYAFDRCENLRSVQLPEGIERIEDGTFWRCHLLEEINVPNSVKKIEDWAFRECNALESITIPNAVKSMGQIVFKNCFALRKVTLPAHFKDSGSLYGMFEDTIDDLMIGGCVFNFVDVGKTETLLPDEIYDIVHEEHREELIRQLNRDVIELAHIEKRIENNKELLERLTKMKEYAQGSSLEKRKYIDKEMFL